MKLIQATNRTYFLYALVAFLIGGGVSFFILKTTIYEEIDEALLVKKDQVVAAIESNPGISSEFLPPEGLTIIALPSKQENNTSWLDTLMLEAPDEEDAYETETEIGFEPFRQLTVIQSIGNISYQITLRTSLIETEDLVFTVFISFMILFTLLLAGLTLINYLIIRKTWAPFFQTLESLRHTRIVHPKRLVFKQTSIDEFKQLNETLDSFVGKAINDYQSLKDFTENASHEIRTPLTAITTDLDLLIQTEDLSPVQTTHIQSIYQSVNRLRRLNQGLLLLTKIDNQQYSLSETIPIEPAILASCFRFREMAEVKSIEVTCQPDPDSGSVKGSEILIDILLDNLIKNAIQYSPPGSVVRVEADAHRIVFRNPGDPFPDQGEVLFQRFKKADPAAKSLGLGLAICQQICLVHQLGFHYQYLDGHHVFSMELKDTDS